MASVDVAGVFTYRNFYVVGFTDSVRGLTTDVLRFSTCYVIALAFYTDRFFSNNFDRKETIQQKNINGLSTVMANKNHYRKSSPIEKVHPFEQPSHL